MLEHFSAVILAALRADTPDLRPFYKVPSAFIPSVTVSLASPRKWSTPSYVVAAVAYTLPTIEHSDNVRKGVRFDQYSQ